MFEVLVDHEDALILAVPAQAGVHADDLAVGRPGEEGPLQGGIQHVDQSLHGQEQWEMVRLEHRERVGQLPLLLGCVLLLCLLLLQLEQSDQLAPLCLGLILIPRFSNSLSLLALFISFIAVCNGIFAPFQPHKMRL